MPRNESRASAPPGATIRCAVAAVLCLACLAGCSNIAVMTGKMLLGNPKQKSAFEMRTGVSLEKQGRKVAVICTAPSSALAEFDGLELDLQEEITRRMRIRELNVATDDEVNTALNRTNGRFNKDTLAASLDDVDYLVHVDVEQFSHTEDGNPRLFRGRAIGMIYSYEVTRDLEKTARPRADKVFFQQFDTAYPTSQPFSADSMSIRVFQQKFVDHLADLVGRSFYDVETADLFN